MKAIASPADHGALTGNAVDLRRPFAHKFRTQKHHYVYDVNTNTVVRVGSAEYSVIDDFGIRSLDELVASPPPPARPHQIRQAYHSICEAKSKHGVFSNNRPSRIAHPLDEPTLTELCDSNLSRLTLCVTEQCNLRCAYCAYSGSYVNARTHSNRFMTWEVARSAIDYLKAHSTLSDSVTIFFYGGEPLLKPSLLTRCMRYAKSLFGRKPCTFVLSTNATCLRGPICEALVDYDVQVYVSLDGPQPMHDRYRRFASGEPTFETIRANLGAFKASHPDFYTSNIIFLMVLAPPFDCAAIERFIDQEEVVRDHQIMVAFVSTSATTFFDRFTAAELDNTQMVRKESDYLRELTKCHTARVYNKLNEQLFGQFGELAQRLAPAPPLFTAFHPGGICIPGLQKLFVTVDGGFFPCEKVDTSTALLSFGNIRTGIDVKKVMSLIKTYTDLNDDCRTCYAIRHCQVCFVDTYHQGEFKPQNKRDICNLIRAGFHDSLIKLMTIMETNRHPFADIKIVNEMPLV